MKGPTKVKMKEIDPQKNFCSPNIKKVTRAYESLNPAMGWMVIQTIISELKEKKTKFQKLVCFSDEVLI